MNKRRSYSRKGRRPATTAKKIERVIKAIPYTLLVFVVVWACFIVVRKAVRPVLLYAREKQETAQIERELKQIQAENARMKKQNTYLKSPQGAQTEARKLGYVYPGEVSIMLEPNPPKKQQ